MLQDRAGHILVCSEQGVFAYDGRRFVNLGPKQGLRDGDVVYGIALTTDGRIAVEYPDEVRISDRSTDAIHPPSSLWFTPVRHPGISFTSDRPHRIAPWQDGLVLLAGASTVKIVVPAQAPPYVETMGYDPSEAAALSDASAVFSVQGRLWEAFPDGRLCKADPGEVGCYGAADGLTGGQVFDVIAGTGNDVVARSATSVSTFDPASSHWTTATLPDQGEQYLNFLSWLALYRDPDGHLVTQSDHGLAVLRDGVWRAMVVAAGAPSGTIVSAMTDATGQFWLQALGFGLIRWVGYGHWQAIDRSDGLPEGTIWQTAGLPGGSIWVATDGGLAEIIRRSDSLQLGRVISGSSFSLGMSTDGKLWSSFGGHGVRVIDPVDGSSTKVDAPAVNVISPDTAGAVWLGTQDGLFRVDDRPGVPLQAKREGAPRAEVATIVPDGSGGIYYIAWGHLRHRHRDDRDVLVSGPWPSNRFNPIAMALGKDGSLWTGGLSGLFHFRLAGDHLTAFEAIPTAATQSSTIMALMMDHRGWVWAGTALGVSVFDGSRWVSIDADSGLLGSDVDQGGLREDPDGTVWIATSRGLSHLLDPTWPVADRPIKAVISDAHLGSSLVTGGQMPYSTEGLAVDFGTPTYGAEHSIFFRYRLAGVDANWVDSTSGTVRYAFVPPGRHLLTVVGIDRLTHRTSEPCTLMVDMAFPWWRQWWAEILQGLLALFALYGLIRLRLRVVLARQRELKRHVAAATAQLQASTAQLRARTEELHFQAAHDSLTSLLNRSEIERRLARTLESGAAGDELIVALLDVDHFKRINDRHGHLGGDAVLRAMGRLVSEAIGKDELAGRYGGEEILLVLQDANGGGAGRVLDLHRAVQEHLFMAAGSAITVTCSIGLTWAERGDDWESLIGRADEALYQAKTGGRNRVIESPRMDRGQAKKPNDDPAPDPSTEV